MYLFNIKMRFLLQFEGVEFIDKRAAFREEYGKAGGSSSGGGSHSKNLDFWMRDSTSKSFYRKQMMRQPSPAGKARAARQDGRRESREGSSLGSGLVLIALVVVAAIFLFGR